MDEAVRLARAGGQLVRVAEPAQDLGDHERDDWKRQRAGLHQRVQVDTLDQLHDEEQAAGRIAVEVDHRDHVGVLQPRAQVRLGDEHLHEGRVLGVAGQDALDRDPTGEALDPGGTAEEHLRHTATAEPTFQNVLAQPHRGRR